MNLGADHHAIQECGSAPSSKASQYLQDCVFLAAVEILSLIAYAPRIGFYADDWAFLAHFKACPSQSFPSLLGCLYAQAPQTRYRPLQVFLLATIYKCAGTHPLGSQVCIALLLIAAVLLFYVLFRELRAPRFLALSVSLVFGLLPHYSTDRFWMASSQSLLAMVLVLLGFYSVLRAASSNRRARWPWLAGCMAAFAASALAYEIFVPSFILAPVLYWYCLRSRQCGKPFDEQGMSREAIVFSVAAAVLVAVVSAYKFAAILGTLHFRFLQHMPREIRQGVVRAIGFNYGYYGLGLPAVAWNAARFYPNTGILILAAVLACAIVAYFFRVVRVSGFPRPGVWAKLLAVGLVVYGLGYSPFFARPDLRFTTASPENRIVLAAAVGAAISIVSLLGLASSLPRSNVVRTRVFTILLTAVAVSGFIIVNTIACFWVAAYQRENAIVASIRRTFPVLPAGTTLILDGVCASVGPAPSFGFDFDLMGVLSRDYGSPGLRADVVNPSMKVEEDGLASTTFGSTDHYPYGSNLIIFNPREGIVRRLTNVKAAHKYFRLHDPDFMSDCTPPRWSLSAYPFKKSGFVRDACSNRHGTR